MSTKQSLSRQWASGHVGRSPPVLALFAVIGLFGLSGCIIPVPADVTEQSGPQAVAEPLAADEAVVVLGTDDFAECVREELADRLPDSAIVSPAAYHRLANSDTNATLQLTSVDSDNATGGPPDADTSGSGVVRVRFAITVHGSNSSTENAYWAIGGTFTEQAHIRAIIEDLRDGTKLEPVSVTTSGDGIVHLVPYAIIGAIAPVTDAPACDAAADTIMAAIGPDAAGSDRGDTSSAGTTAVIDDPDEDEGNTNRDGR